MKLFDRGFKTKETLRDIPFAHEVIFSPDLNQRNRLKHYLKMIEKISEPCLDISDPNWIGEQISKQHNIKIENTLKSDFNDSIKTKSEKYETILCFEVLEHVMNPSHFLKEIHKLLTPSGVLYLSTPKLAVIPIYQTDAHFIEYKEHGLSRMFDYCGFKIVNSEIFSPFPAWWAVTGFRPFFRTAFHRIQLYKLVKV
ncbi:MAG: methyltransferase domain-containing protein [Ignavibacteriales bacterium]|nr:methyltransferase domain-containing protein [Ignavibacteriales bacterium]